MPRKAIIIGAGPAGLTAAYELLKRTDIVPIILEKTGDIGGISKTVNYKGNRIDIGGHRFFSKSDRVMQWWMNIMPIETSAQENITISYHNQSRRVNPENGLKESDPNKMMLVRKRLSRIYFLRKFFAYPIQLSMDTLVKLGPVKTIKILTSYFWARIFPIKPEKSLEDFFINRFGKQLYRLFFKDYTEKVWGVPCEKISAEWGAQRIKGVSIGKAISHAVQSLRNKKSGSIDQKNVETSLIERFLYPKYGPGQLWEEVARQVCEMGGEIRMHQDVRAINIKDGQVDSVETFNKLNGTSSCIEGNYFFSTMPVKELVASMNGQIPETVKNVAAGLQYRDFITVGILLRKLPNKDLRDTWIYIQENDVKVGRIQLFHNWSPYLVKDPQNSWIGMEYFCNEGDSFWEQSDEDIKQQAISELQKIRLGNAEDVLDSTVLRMEKTYPAYFGTYPDFGTVRNYLDGYPNLFLIGRNGMHKYNNSDHSILTAMAAVDNIISGKTSKDNIWAINTEQQYHEEKEPPETGREPSPEKQIAPPKESFWDFLWNNRVNRRWLYIAGIATLLQFIIFKYLYPFASFIHDDSFIYLKSAQQDLAIDFFPIGYSRFLRLFSVFTSSDTALVLFQYGCIQASALFLLFTIDYFFNPKAAARNILICFSVFNPLYLNLANLVSTDALFLALSLTWFGLLIWIAQRPSFKAILAHAVVLFLAFIVRYNALIYPLIAIVPFWLSPWRLRNKVFGYGLSLLFCGLFIVNTAQQFKQLTGIWQFSPFGGWQLANNAMDAYRYVDSAERKPAPARFRQLDGLVRVYFNSTRDPNRFPYEYMKTSTAYMWSKGLPLMTYMALKFKNDSAADKLSKWASMGPLYNGYGTWLIRQYPKQFALYFLWPNFINYYAPPVEYLEQYNSGFENVNNSARDWFRYKSNKVYSRLEGKSFNILDAYPVFTAIMNVILLCSLLCFVMLQGFLEKKPFRRMILIGITFWLINAAFTIFASPAVLRFQTFAVILVTILAVLLLDWMLQVMAAKAREEHKHFSNVNLKMAD